MLGGNTSTKEFSHSLIECQQHNTSMATKHVRHLPQCIWDLLQSLDLGIQEDSVLSTEGVIRTNGDGFGALHIWVYIGRN